MLIIIIATTHLSFFFALTTIIVRMRIYFCAFNLENKKELCGPGDRRAKQNLTMIMNFYHKCDTCVEFFESTNVGRFSNWVVNNAYPRCGQILLKAAGSLWRSIFRGFLNSSNTQKKSLKKLIAWFKNWVWFFKVTPKKILSAILCGS